MNYGICNLSIVPLRVDPADQSEMVTQLLFGEHFKVLEIRKKWSKIRLAFDNYEGWIDNKQFQLTDDITYEKMEQSMPHYAGELIDFVTDEHQNFSTITIGANLPFFKEQNLKINEIGLKIHK